MAEKPEGGPPKRGAAPQIPLLWVVLLAVMTVFYAAAIARLFTPPAEPTIPYSALLSDVRAGRVSGVQIAGDQITGTFVKAHAAFRSTFPATVGDPDFLPLLQKHRVTIVATTNSAPWLLQVIVSAAPWLLLIGFFVWMAWAVRNQAGAAGRFGRVKPQRYFADRRPAVTFDDIAGADEAKAELQEEVDFLRHSKKYRDLGARIPKGILLVGAPGTGKTLLARAVAGQAAVPFLSLNASEFVEMFVGVGASRVRDLFTQAKEAAPAIVFIDELDAVGRRRGAGIGTVNDEREQTLNQLLAELDGFDERFDVIILAATNRPDVLDPALLRPGRFDRQVVIDLPDREGREGILKIHARPLKLDPGVNLATLAAATIGMSGADLANLCNEAALTAARHDHPVVTALDFDEAQDKIRMGAPQQRLASRSEQRVTAYHEAGHAVVAWQNPDADPIAKVTIVPRGQALGHTQQVPGEDRRNFSRSYLRAKLAVGLAGRIAEEIAFGEMTTGAEQDLVEATALARRMVTRWGMGDLGLLALRADEEQPFLGYEMARGHEYSEETAARIDRSVERLLEDAYREARQTLTDARDGLDRLAAALVQKETLSLEEVTAVLGQRRLVPAQV